MRNWKIAGINFDHMHMGDLLRMVHEHLRAQLVGICDERPEKMRQAIANFKLSEDQVFTDYRKCLEQTKPDLVVLCPATAEHALWTEKVAPFGTHVMVEKPFAASVAEADRMIAAMKGSHGQLAIDWPMRWYPTHSTAKRLIDEGAIGEVIEIHYYDGNRGPTYHLADKISVSDEEAQRAKATSWWYRKSSGGGSLLDYLGYGTTLGTWFLNGRIPLEVTAAIFVPRGLEVDEHGIVIARYETGLSKFETRWGTFTDPWTHQPQPKCGFVLVGREGTISSYDREDSIRIQTRSKPQGEVLPADRPQAPYRNPIEYMIDRMESEKPVDGPLSPTISRIGQQIVDAAVISAVERRTVTL